MSDDRDRSGTGGLFVAIVFLMTVVAIIGFGFVGLRYAHVKRVMEVQRDEARVKQMETYLRNQAAAKANAERLDRESANTPSDDNQPDQ